MAIGGPTSSDDGEDEAIFADINITPLTDVFLVMVIIFMISALAVQVEARQERARSQADRRASSEKQGVKINLPAGEAQEIDNPKAALTLEITAAGEVFSEGKPLPLGALDAMFRAAYVRDKLTQVVLKADKGTPHGRIVEIMERAKQAGLSALAFATGGT